jgi:hypothetical protein
MLDRVDHRQHLVKVIGSKTSGQAGLVPLTKTPKQETERRGGDPVALPCSEPLARGVSFISADLRLRWLNIPAGVDNRSSTLRLHQADYPAHAL